MHIGYNVDVIIRIVGGKRFPHRAFLGAAIARDGRTFSVNDQIVDSRISLRDKSTGFVLTNFFQFPFNGLFRSRGMVWLECGRGM